MPWKNPKTVKKKKVKYALRTLTALIVFYHSFLNLSVHALALLWVSLIYQRQ